MYKDPVIQTVIDLLDGTGPSKLRGRYVNGDVLQPNKTELPLCYITRDTTTVTAETNMQDLHQASLVATVILDWTQDLDQAYDMVAGTPELYEMCEGRNDNFTLREDTMLYCLRKDQQLNGGLWLGVDSPVEVSYGIGVDRRGPGSFSIEAVIRFTAKMYVPNIAE
jgi:hypothetical protein